MLSAPSSRAQQLIYQRRAQQDKLVRMQTKLKQQFHQSQFARWQNKGSQIEVNNQVKQKLAVLRQQSQATLQARRQRLGELLAAEDGQLRREVVDLQETPEQMRERMARRVAELKEEKERRRVAEVNNKLEKRFEQNADELRKVDQDLKELKLAYERNMQLVEKQGIMQNQYEEQMLFAELNKRDIKKKEQQQRLKRQQQQQKVEQRNAVLAIQKELRKRKEDEQRVMGAAQKEMLRQQWQRQSELAKLKEKQVQQKQKEVHRTIHEQNQKIKKDKEEALVRERAADRAMIQRIVQKERQLGEYEKVMKEKEREEARRALAGLKNKKEDMLAYERELDRLIEGERIKKEQKQQQDWEKREKARVNLLYQVFEDRERKVKEHRGEREEDLRVREQDRAEVERRVAEYEQEQERRKRDEFERNRAEQQKILEEIALKEEKRRVILQELQREEQQQFASKNEYERKIEERKQQGREQFEEFKKTHRLF